MEQDENFERRAYDLLNQIRGLCPQGQYGLVLTCGCYLYYSISKGDVAGPQFMASANKSKNDLAISAARILQNLLGEGNATKLVTSFLRILDGASGEDCVRLIGHLEDSSFLDDSFGNSNASIDQLVCELLHLQPDDVVYDAGSGTGTFLCFATEFAREHKITGLSFSGQELNATSASICSMKMSMLGVKYSITIADSLSRSPSSFTKAFAFPPFGLKYGPEYGARFNSRGRQLFTPRTSSEWLFIYKALENLKDDSILVALLPSGTLFRAADSELRSWLLRSHLIEGVIALPTGSLVYSGVALSILVFKKNSLRVKILDATKMVSGSNARFVSRKILVDDIVNAYFDDKVTTLPAEELAEKEAILTPDSLLQPDSACLKDPKPLSEVTTDVLRGSQYTLANFADQLSDEKTNYQLVTSSNIEDGLIDYDSLPYLKPDPKLDKFALQQGDLLMTSKSSKVKMAVADFQGDRKIIVSGGMLIVRPKPGVLDASYLKIFLSSKPGQIVLNRIKKGSTIVSINVSDLRDITISCPSFDQQVKMAQKFNSLLTTLDALKKQTQSVESRLANLYDDQNEED